MQRKGGTGAGPVRAMRALSGFDPPLASAGTVDIHGIDGCAQVRSVAMNVTLKLFAMLADHLPQQVDGRVRQGNVVELEVPEGTTVSQLIERFALPPRLVHLVLVNGHYVPPAERASRALSNGEALAIWPPIAGG